MKYPIFQNAPTDRKDRQRKKRWYQISACLAVVVVFCTVYALMYPAITMEQTQCDIPEHTHDASCYTQITSIPRTELVCTMEDTALHEHTADCFQTVEEPVDTQTLTCQIPESEAHQHSVLCYGTWELTCDLQEHTHTEDCHVPEETPENPVASPETEETPADPVASTETKEPLESDLPSELPVLGTAYASTAGKQLYGIMPLDDDTAEQPEPLNVEGYVNTAALSYRTDGSSDWKPVAGATEIPGDADFKLDISYRNVPLDDLLAADGKMIYTLPDLLRNPSANGKITSGNEVVGTITVEGNAVAISFELDWLNAQKEGTNTVINGDFTLEAKANLLEIEDEGPSQIQIGDVTIEIDFAGDIVAQYGNVDITKTVSTISEEADGDYLTYTLTVTAGADGCPDVKVVDMFTANGSYVSYVGLNTTSTTLDSTGSPSENIADGKAHGSAYCEGAAANAPGTLVWEIGNMAPDETRTLTYRVKLDDSYTGASAKGEIQNTADVYAKAYNRDCDTATFTPKAGATMSKVASTFTPNESGDGSGTITYTVWVQAYAENSYTLDNVKIVDALDGSIQGINPTSNDIRQSLSYEDASFHLYQGGVNKQDGSSGLTEIQDGTGPTFSDTDQDGKNNDSFTYYVGSLAPGECKTLTYTVKVEPGVFAAAGNDAAKINNRARIFDDENKALSAYNTSKTLDRKVWDRKLVGDALTEEKTVTMSGTVYDATGSAVTLIPDPDSTFTVPAGSYQYQVAANEAGDWDLSSASMKDALDSQHMQFVGYVRVDAYTVTDKVPGSGLTDAEAIADLSARTPAQTVWVKVDGTQSFGFKPEEIGLDGAYAYLLTYYARPVDTDGITQVVVNNRFSLEGVSEIGDTQYTLTGIEVSASVTVEGDNRFFAEKLSWYYEPFNGDAAGDFSKGALYWAIKVDGTTIPAGTQIQDVTNAAGGSTHYIRAASLAATYIGNLGSASVTDFDNLAALQGSGQVTELPTESYTVTKTNETLTVQFRQDIKLESEEALYLIVKTEPNVLPANQRDTKTFHNTLRSSSDGDSWVDHNVASQTLYGSENIFKELGRVFTYPGTGSTITDILTSTKQAIATSELTGAGTYVAWQIHVNYEGNLSGRCRVVEQIPDGMELAYVRIWWLGSKANQQNPKPTVVALTDEEFAALGEGWTKNVKTIGSNNIGTQNNYYYTKGQQVIWEIDHLHPGGQRDEYAVEFQIVCRVTDSDVLLSGEAKDFNNTVTLQNRDGEVLGSDSNVVTIQKQTLQKTGLYNSDINGGRYPFKLTLNELGEDLVEGVDTITLVDELSSTLILDTTSIKVVNTKTGDEVTDWTASVDGQTLKLVLPDHVPLTITYEAIVNAAPGQNVSISNHAHWEGYPAPSGGSVEDNKFSYTVGGTVDADTSPSVTVLKVDQYNTSSYLSGAAFTLQEGAFSGGIFTPTEDGLSLTGTTGTDGTLSFGKDAGQMMKYNTVYCLTETEAPSGYVLDATPHYFAIAKQEDGSYPDFPEGVTVWYQGPDYTCEAYNHKGEAAVRKRFLDGGGNPLDKLTGTYRFGIYDSETPTAAPLQTVAITYASGTVTPEGGTAKFTNLELGKTYCIYELDNQNQPVQHGTLATVDGKNFIVTYTDSPEVTVSPDATATVTVTNQVCYPELPDSGGTGTLLFPLAGLLLMAGAGFFLLYRHTKRK